MTREFWPSKILISPEAKDDAITKRVIHGLNKHTEINGTQRELVYLDHPLEGDPLGANSTNENPISRFNQGKRTLLISHYKGQWLKPCPGTQEHVCCNLWIVNPGEGCPLDCTYCYLQNYLLRNPTLKIYSNIDSLLGALETQALGAPERFFRVGTGEVIDSLVWDELTGLTTDLVPFFGRQKNLTLELKSKFDYVENLVNLKNDHRGNTVVSWSVNARSITEKDEAFTAPLTSRIQAAARVVAAGYRVGFHFDPMIHFANWEDEYLETVKEIFNTIDSRRIAWVSLSTLRYKPKMQEIMKSRFPQSKIPYGEQFLAADEKIRYIQPLRLKMLRFMWRELKARNPNLPVYLCMESSTAWKELGSDGEGLAGEELSFAGLPGTRPELVEIFSRKKKPAQQILSGGEL
ncbi:DNA photolyase [bacterium]|nr:DNA photolyase [bacterium]